MSLEIIVRLIGLVVFGIIGIFLGEPLGILIQEIWPTSPLTIIIYQIITTLLIGFLGFLISPWISIKPISAICFWVNRSDSWSYLICPSGLSNLTPARSFR